MPRHPCGTPPLMPAMSIATHTAMLPGVHLCRRRGAIRLRPVPTWCSQEAAAEQIKVCSANHLAFQHLEAVDVSRDRAGTPGQGHPSFDCLIVLLEPARKALPGLQRTGRRAREPGIEARRLPLADEVGKVLCQVDRLSDLGRLRVELGELLGFGRRAALCASQD